MDNKYVQFGLVGAAAIWGAHAVEDMEAYKKLTTDSEKRNYRYLAGAAAAIAVGVFVLKKG